MLNTKSFIEKARKIHGDKYDYSKVEYKHCTKKVCIICPEHGEFWQTPSSHLNSKIGCPKCGKNSSTNMVSNEKFIEKAKKIHGNEYDYSKTCYLGWDKKVCIICPEHGEFWQKAGEHVARKRGCPHCALEKNINDSISKGKESFEKYMKNYNGIYEMVGDYVDSSTKVEFRCKKHNTIFIQTPNNFRNIKTPCPECRCDLKKPKKQISHIQPDYKKICIEKIEQKYPNRFSFEKMDYKNRDTKVLLFDKIINEWVETIPSSLLKASNIEKVVGYEKTKLPTILFIEKARKVHGDKYDYTKVKYVNSKTKVCIVCHEKDEEGNEHGEFWQTPNDHLKECACPKCGHRVPWTTEAFIEKARKVHGNKYDYSNVCIKNTIKHITLFCPEHGEFQIRACHHLKGSGCPKCNGSGGEKALLSFFNNKKLYPLYNKRYKWLDNYQLDFYFPEYNIAIEVQGEQHFKDIPGFSDLVIQQTRDEKKKEMCKKYGIKIFYFATFNMNFPYHVYTDINKMWSDIEEYIAEKS